MYCVIHILIHKHTLFFSLQITINMSQIKTTDEVIAESSDDAKIVLIKMGIDWKNMTGNSCSWVSNDLLNKLLKIEFSWTINALKKFSGCGRAGIEWGLMPKFKEYNLVEKDEQVSGRFDYWKLTNVGREVLTMMMTCCSECNNTGICQQCEGTGIKEDHIPCEHTLYTECNGCNESGKDEDGEECWICIGPGQTCSECNNTNFKTEKCSWCCGYYKTEDQKGRCYHCH